jgi:hypothetical protein
MVHQCASEENWFGGMLGIPISGPPLPAEETRDAFIECYASASASGSRSSRADRGHRRPGGERRTRDLSI